MEARTCKIVLEPELSFKFKSWLFKNSMYRFEDLKRTIKRVDYETEKVEEVTVGGEEAAIFCVQEIVEHYETLTIEGVENPGTDEDETLIHKLFSEEVIYFELEFNLDYYAD